MPKRASFHFACMVLPLNKRSAIVEALAGLTSVQGEGVSRNNKRNNKRMFRIGKASEIEQTLRTLSGPRPWVPGCPELFARSIRPELQDPGAREIPETNLTCFKESMLVL